MLICKQLIKDIFIHNAYELHFNMYIMAVLLTLEGPTVASISPNCLIFNRLSLEPEREMHGYRC